MLEYKVILTWEAIYDVTDIAEKIEEQFGIQRADKFQIDIRAKLSDLGHLAHAFPKTQILYRNYAIQKRPFPPSVIFYIILEDKQEIHVLRVLREKQDWQRILVNKKEYTYL